ncbi:PAP2-domain-containing protein [Cristinia sonorae]|uniref:PAP2-domain-containing protein n=1 Tax=Cristinia sonorae TaxID=1940300 RepID=A0A8K0UX90_9AGAR|nr:PAP2-domain-containing protein [Cristinia sonorae]
MSTQQRNQMRWKLIRTYGPDWILCIGLVALFGALDNISGFKREFSLEDTSLRHPHTLHERVPNWALYIICSLTPAVLEAAVNYLTVRSWWDLHNSLLGLLLGLSLTGAITQVVKLTVGRPRPDIIARCIPFPGAVDPPLGLSNYTICTRGPGHILDDGWRSFPSGHSSLSFAGLGFLSFYLAGKLHLFDKRGQAHKSWIALTPLAGATLVAVSRTMDYRHHWQDVTAGSILGLVMSYFAYRQYYPSLASPYSHRPYFPRHKPSPQDSMSLPLHRDPQVVGHDPEQHYPNGGYRDSLLRDHHEQDGPVNMEDVPAGTYPKDEVHDMETVWRDSEGESEELDGNHRPVNAHHNTR